MQNGVNKMYFVCICDCDVQKFRNTCILKALALTVSVLAGNDTFNKTNVKSLLVDLFIYFNLMGCSVLLFLCRLTASCDVFKQYKISSFL